MSIWEYASISTDIGFVTASLGMTECSFCKYELRTVVSDRQNVAENNSSGVPLAFSARDIKICDCCGWWKVAATEMHDVQGLSPTAYAQRRGAIATLRNFDLSVRTDAIDDAKSFLMANYGERLNIDRRTWERVVESVFRSIGYATRITGYSKDGGIDVIMDGPNNSTIGVQVRHSKNTIQVEPIRSLAGALIEHGHYQGFFVTTSDFSRGAVDAANTFRMRGIPVSLLNADRFYEALRLAQLSTTRELDAKVLGMPFSDMIYIPGSRTGAVGGRSRIRPLKKRR